MAELLGAVAQAIRQDELCAVVTVLSGDAIGRKMLVRRERKADRDAPTVATTGSLGDEALEQAATSLAADAMEARRTTRITLPAKDQDWDLLIDVHVPQERLIVVGAVHIAIPLVSFARELGLYTVVIDARPIFATQDRFGHVDELIRSWPDEALQEMKLNESSYVVTLTHDEKLDTPALICALDHPVGYIGALGSKRTHAKRVTALREAGVSDEQISRIHAPIGLDLGGRSPGEIALAIMAEIVQIRNRVKEAGR
ncbi:MAG: XdhC family protein [Caldilineaceae bacterium]|nr:XdhC family protein [Caldilineaceae bacterium]